MFISSMARINQLKRSKSEGNIRKESRRNGHRTRFHKNEVAEGDSYNEDGGKPPQSQVKKSNVIFVDGSVKQMQKIRDHKNLSNSAKTIRPTRRSLPPNSSVELTASSNSLDRSHHEMNTLLGNVEDISANQVDDNNEYLSQDMENKLVISRTIFPEERTLNNLSNTPYGPNWYLDPVHRKTTFNDRSLLGNVHRDTSFLSTDSDDIDYYYDDEKECGSDVGLDYLEMSRSLERDALERAASTSPYELELCRLRKEKLRLEESYLLKKKCEIELERTRGPKPKWYELKTPEFTVEMEKYDNIMGLKEHWSELIDYRNQLDETSRRLEDP